jgi:hypothetical protein
MPSFPLQLKCTRLFLKAQPHSARPEILKSNSLNIQKMRRNESNKFCKYPYALPSVRRIRVINKKQFRDQNRVLAEKESIFEERKMKFRRADKSGQES